MKKIYIFLIFIFSGKITFSQELPPSSLAANPQEIKNLMGKNISEGKSQYDGINSVFTIKLKGLKEESQFRNFDEGMLKYYTGKNFSCSSDFKNGKTTIIADGNTDISDLKVLIYEQGKIIVPPNGVEILDYRKDYFIKK